MEENQFGFCDKCGSEIYAVIQPSKLNEPKKSDFLRGIIHGTGIV
jgi:hypothetical protein